MPQENSVRAVERALSILDCYTTGKGCFTLIEIARMINLSPSTTLRLLSTLEKRNYIFRDPESLKYYLGFRLAQISNISFENLDFCRVARPYMQQLNNLFNESVGISMVKRGHRVCVDRIEGTRPLRSVLSIGMPQPLTRGASGRMLLSHQSEEFILSQLHEDPFVTLSDLQEVKRQGYAVSYGEREPGIVSVAAPILDSQRKLVATLFLSAPTARVDEALVERFIQAVTDSAYKISCQLGFSDV